MRLATRYKLNEILPLSDKFNNTCATLIASRLVVY